HPPHIRVVDDGGVLAGGADRQALAALLRVVEGLLVGALADGEALHADRETGAVHHDEHDAHSLVLFADEVAGGVLVVHDAGGGAVDTQLLLYREALDAVAVTQRTVLVHHALGNDETGDSAGALRGAGRTRQNQVNDLLAQVVLAEADEDLLAADLVGSVVLRHRAGGECTDIRPSLRFGQVHGAGPFAAHHVGQVGLL